MKLVVFGDSWTFGSELRDPELDFTKIKEWDIQNEKYRKQFIWPNKLGAMFNVESIINLSYPSSSNDRILRTAIDWLIVNYISKKIPTNDLLIIIGFTNMSRRDFYYDGPTKSHWQTIWPTVEYEYGHKDINQFVELYEDNFFTPVDDINRYINQVHYLELFLKKYNINYLTFQAFYHKIGQPIEKWEDLVYTKSLGYENDWKYKNRYEVSDILRWKEIDPIRFIDKDKKTHSFHNRIIKIAKEREISDIFASVIRMHPNEVGHLLWAEYLYEYIIKYNLIDNLNYQNFENKNFKNKKIL